MLQKIMIWLMLFKTLLTHIRNSYIIKVMIKVLMLQVDQIEKAFLNGQLTAKEVKYEMDLIDALLDAKELEVLGGVWA